MTFDWSTACLDWEARLMTGRSLVPELPLYPAEVEKALRVFGRLKLPDVFGKPTLHEATGQWFKDIVAALFGSYDVETNRRMIQEVFLLVPKKNGKSTNAAAVILTAVILNRRPEAEFLLIAPTKEIADISFRQAAGMIKIDPELSKLFQPQRHIRTITHRISGAMIQIKAADTDAITGVKATGILIDETHVFSNKPRAADVFIEVRGALTARPDGFMFQITTQSKTPPAGVFDKELRRARKVRDGKRTLPLLPVLYELPQRLAKNNGWKSMKLIRRVNPNMGRSVNEEFLIREMESAEEDGIEQLALFASQHANVEIGLALGTDHWVGAQHWESCSGKVTLDAILERSDAVVVGIDGGGLDDLLGLAVLGRDRQTGEWLLWNHAWAYEIALERRKSEAARMKGFKDLTIVKQLGDDIDEVADIVAGINDAGLLHQVGVDPVGIGLLVHALVDKEIDEDKIVSVPQGYKLSGAIKTLERKLVERSVTHAGQKMMNWSVGNARSEVRGNALLITKQASGTAKIDPLIASFVAVALMGMNPPSMGPSVYESRGLLEVTL